LQKIISISIIKTGEEGVRHEAEVEVEEKAQGAG
jgi:hypothetical protein